MLSFRRSKSAWPCRAVLCCAVTAVLCGAGLCLGLVMYIFAVMGMAVFAKNDPFHFGGQCCRAYYDSIMVVMALPMPITIAASQWGGTACSAVRRTQHTTQLALALARLPRAPGLRPLAWAVP